MMNKTITTNNGRAVEWNEIRSGQVRLGFRPESTKNREGWRKEVIELKLPFFFYHTTAGSRWILRDITRESEEKRHSHERDVKYLF